KSLNRRARPDHLVAKFDVVLGTNGKVIQGRNANFTLLCSDDCRDRILAPSSRAILPDYSAAAFGSWPRRLPSVSMRSAAASAITVPGGKIASAPARLSAS